MDALAEITTEIDQLTTNDLTLAFDGRTFLRGHSLANYNKVSSPRASHNQLTARVYDNTSRPFKVTVTVSSDGFQTSCSCQSGEPCAHAAALLILWVQRRQAFLFTPLDRRNRPLPFPQAYSIWQGQPNEEHAASLLLTVQRISELRKIGQQLVEADTGQSKEEFAWQIAPLLGQADKLRPLLAGCDQHEEAVLQVLALFDGDLGPTDITEVLEKLGSPKPQVTSALKTLQSRGLALSRKPSQPNAPLWSIPNEVLPHLPKGNLRLAKAWQGADDQAPAQPDLLVTLRAFCFLVKNKALSAQVEPKRSSFEERYPAFAGWYNKSEEVEYFAQANRVLFATQNAFLTMQEPPLAISNELLEQIAARLQAPAAQLGLILRLLKQLYLIEVVDEKLRLNERMEQFWQRSEDDQLRLLLSTWANELVWSELHGLPDIQVRRNLNATFSGLIDQLYAEWAVLRRAIVRLIRHFKPAQTYDLADFYQRLQRLMPKLAQHLLGDLYGQVWLLLNTQKKPLKLEASSSWRTIFLPYLQQVLSQLSYFGMIQIGHQGASISLTARGARLLDIEPSVVANNPKVELSIDTDLRIALPIQQAYSALLSQLEQFSELVDLSQTHLHYQISPRRFRNALTAGWDAQAISAFLKEHTTKKLPKQIVTTIQNWSQSFGQNQFYPNLAILELADDVVVTELLRQTRLSSVLLHQISPRLLVLDPAQLSAFWEELVAKGYTPQRASLLNPRSNN